jgi:hypothetical protein
MVTLDDVAAAALGLAEVSEHDRRGSRVWSVRDKVFAWEREFSKADRKRFGDHPVPVGPIVAVRVADLGEKEAVLAANHRGFFTIPHFDGFAAILIDLSKAGKRAVTEALLDGWFAQAPPALVAERKARR